MVQEAVDRLMKNRTVIVIAHRLSTVRDADKIAVFSDGKVADLGSHDELMQTSSIYQNLVKRQLQWGDRPATQSEEEETQDDKTL